MSRSNGKHLLIPEFLHVALDLLTVCRPGDSAIGLREPSAKPARTEEEPRRWRAYLTVGEEDEPEEVVVYCPDCAEREFEATMAKNDTTLSRATRRP
jgi:hypothetical protein